MWSLSPNKTKCTWNKMQKSGKSDGPLLIFTTKASLTQAKEGDFPMRELRRTKEAPPASPPPAETFFRQIITLASFCFIELCPLPHFYCLLNYE